MVKLRPIEHYNGFFQQLFCFFPSHQFVVVHFGKYIDVCQLFGVFVDLLLKAQGNAVHSLPGVQYR